VLDEKLGSMPRIVLFVKGGGYWEKRKKRQESRDLPISGTGGMKKVDIIGEHYHL